MTILPGMLYSVQHPSIITGRAMSDETLALRAFGRTGIDVTPLCIGCAPLGDMPDTFAYGVSEAQALETLRAAFAGPIRFIDTAASYGDGEAERRIGLVLRELGGLPAGYVLASKADRNLRTGEFSGAQMRRSVERSLRLLGVDQIEIMHLHDPEHTTFAACMAPGGPVEVLMQLQAEGLVRHLGVAGGPADLMIRYVETGVFAAVITHNRYTLLNRSADRLLTVAAERGLAVLNAAPYGSGLLADRIGRADRTNYRPAAGHRAGAGARGDLRAPWRAARGGGAAVLDARSAHHVDDHRHDAPRAHRADDGAGDVRHPAGRVAGIRRGAVRHR